jgi:hypothetical protein
MIDQALERVANEVDKILHPPPANVVALAKGKGTRKG